MSPFTPSILQAASCVARGTPSVCGAPTESGDDLLNAFAEGYYGASRVTRKWVLGSVDVDVDRSGRDWCSGRSGGEGARGGGPIVNRT